MDYYCKICLKKIKAKNKNKHFKSKSHIEFDIYKHKKLFREDIDIENVDEAFFIHYRT